MFNKKDFDSEYSTQYLKELDFLNQNDIRYDFVFTNEKGIRTYKYKKSSKLFEVLFQFYRDKELNEIGN